MYVARVLGVEGIGSANIALSFASFFAMFASVGIPVYGLRELSLVKNDITKINSKISELLTINLISVLICSSIYILIIIFVDFFSINQHLYLICVLNIFLAGIQTDWILQFRGNFRSLATRSFFIKLIAFLCILLFVKDEENIKEYLFIHAFGIGFIGILNLKFILRHYKISFSFNEFFNHMASLKFFFFSRIFSSANSNLDTVILGALTNSFIAGLYSISARLIQALVMFLNSSVTVYFRKISKTLEDNKQKYLESNTELFIFLNILILPFFIFTIIFSKNIIILFGGINFADGNISLMILSFVILFSTTTNFLGMQVLYANKLEKYVLLSVSIGAISSISLNIFLSPTYENIGAAISTLFGWICIAITQVLVIYKYNLSVMNFPMKRYIKILLSNIFLAILLLFISKTISFDNIFYGLLFSYFVGLAAYVLFLYVYNEKIVKSIIKKLV